MIQSIQAINFLKAKNLECNVSKEYIMGKGQQIWDNDASEA